MSFIKRFSLVSVPLVSLAACMIVSSLAGCGGGSSSTATPSPSPSPSSSPTTTTSRFVVTDLGVRDGATSSIGFNLNSQGTVVGDSDIHAFVWSNGVLTDLNTNGLEALHGMGINDIGQVVGGNNISATTTHTDNQAFLWQSGTLTTLGALPIASSDENFSFAYDINNSSQVVGYSGNSSEFHAFLWQSGTMTDLGIPGNGSYSKATAINESGQIVVDGNYGDNIRTYLWSGGGYTDLGLLSGAVVMHGYDINNKTQIVGEAQTSNTSSYTSMAYEWSGGTLTKLTPLSSDSQGIARGINDQGQIVGASIGSSSHAVLWENGTAEQLDSLIPSDSGWTLTDAYKINSAGQITGIGKINGLNHGFLLTPR